MRSFIPGWLDGKGQFTCIKCDSKGAHKAKWVLRFASECIVHNEKKAKQQKVARPASSIGRRRRHTG